MGQRGGKLDLQPALVRIPADRLVAPRLVLLPVGSQEQPGRLPLRRHCASVSPAAARRRACAAGPCRLAPPTPPPPPAAARTRPSRPQRLQADGLGVPLGGGGITAIRPTLPPAGTASRASIRPMRAFRLVFPARRFCSASRHWSSLVRVIAPAHREEDSAVSARFRTARDAARRLASSRPSAHRAARSRPASDPRYVPAARAPPRRPATPAAGPGPAPLPALPPRTAPQPGAGKHSPARHPPSRDGPQSIVRTFETCHKARVRLSAYFRYLRHAERANGSDPDAACWCARSQESALFPRARTCFPGDQARPWGSHTIRRLRAATRSATRDSGPGARGPGAAHPEPASAHAVPTKAALRY